MAKKKKKRSRLAKAMLETARDVHKAGLLDRASYDKITMRHVDAQRLPKVTQLRPEQIRTMRARAKMSQAMFAPSGPRSRLRVAARTQREAADRRNAGPAQRHPTQGNRGDPVRHPATSPLFFVRRGETSGPEAAR
jgi:DNA-binding transcriptional regulator YiaG